MGARARPPPPRDSGSPTLCKGLASSLGHRLRRFERFLRTLTPSFLLLQTLTLTNQPPSLPGMPVLETSPIPEQIPHSSPEVPGIQASEISLIKDAAVEIRCPSSDPGIWAAGPFFSGPENKPPPFLPRTRGLGLLLCFPRIPGVWTFNS